MGAWIDKGYVVVNGLNGQSVYLHRLLWEEAHGPVPEGYIVHHKDGNTLNNELSNLELHTPSSHGKLPRRKFIWSAETRQRRSREISEGWTLEQREVASKRMKEKWKGLTDEQKNKITTNQKAARRPWTKEKRKAHGEMISKNLALVRDKLSTAQQLRRKREREESKHD